MTIMEDRAAMSAASINDLPDSAFAYIEDGGTKDSEGKTTPRSLRHYPVHDAAHARDALGRAQAQIGSGDADAKRIAQAAMPKIRAAARKFGIEVGDGDADDRAARTPPELLKRRRGSMIRKQERRGMLLEMRAKPDGAGGTDFVFEGYGATFDQPFEMWDPWGDPYSEVVRQGAFTRSLGRPDLDVPFLIGHNDAGIPLARTRNGTMRLSQDSRGLHVRAVMDGGRSDVRNLASAVERGDLDEMSIGFVTMGQEWSPDWETRAMTDLELHRGDVSAVALAANPSTAGSTMIALSAWRPGEQRTPTQPYAAHAGETNECVQCHSVNDDAAGYCDQCGTAMKPTGRTSNMADAEDMTQRCGECMQWNSADAKYCGGCGQELAGDQGRGWDLGAWKDGREREQLARGEVADNDSHPDFNVPANDPAANGQQMVKCPYTNRNGCGVMNPGGNRFCGSCGGPIYDGDGLMVLDDAGVVEEVAGAQGDANLLSKRLRLLEITRPAKTRRG